MTGKLRPLDVGRKIRPGKYPDGDGLCLVVASATSENWKDDKQHWLGLTRLAQGRIAKGCAPCSRCCASPSKAIAVHPALASCRRSLRRARNRKSWNQAHSVDVPGMRRNLHPRALVDPSKKHRNQWPSSLKCYTDMTRATSKFLLEEGGVRRFVPSSTIALNSLRIAA